MEKKKMFTLYGNICGDRVRLGRAMHKPPLLQKELAEKVQRFGVDMTTAIVSRIEKGERHVCDAELKVLSVALGVTMDWLCEETNFTESQ